MYTHKHIKTHMGKFKLINIKRFPAIRTRIIIPNNNKNFMNIKPP